MINLENLCLNFPNGFTRLGLNIVNKYVSYLALELEHAS